LSRLADPKLEAFFAHSKPSAVGVETIFVLLEMVLPRISDQGVAGGTLVAENGVGGPFGKNAIEFFLPASKPRIRSRPKTSTATMRAAILNSQGEASASCILELESMSVAAGPSIKPTSITMGESTWTP
jgi:hypothetical protein